MEIKKVKRKEDVKEAILRAAKELLFEKGYEGTSIRNIASKIGYSPTTIYLYYKDKNDIVYKLHQEGFGVLKMMFTALTHVESPFERLKGLGRTYLQFAKDNPDFYELMFMMKEPMNFLDNYSDEIWEGGSEIYQFIVYTIQECQRDGYFVGQEPDSVALQAWGVVHGLCSLFITSRLQKIGVLNMGENDAEKLLETAFNTYVNFVEFNKINHEEK